MKLYTPEALIIKLDTPEDLLKQARILILRDQACMLVHQVIDEVITSSQRQEKGAERLDEIRDQTCMLVRQVIDDVIMAAQRRPTLAQRREKEAERLTEIRALESRLAALKAGGC